MPTLAPIITVDTSATSVDCRVERLERLESGVIWLKNRTSRSQSSYLLALKG